MTDKPAVEDTYEELTEEDFPTDLSFLSEGKCTDIVVAIEDLSPEERARFASTELAWSRGRSKRRL